MRFILVFVWSLLSYVNVFAQQTELKATKHVCKSNDIQFDADETWDHAQWSSNLNGFISNDFSIIYHTTQNDTLNLKLSNDTGESIIYRTPIVISLPALTLESNYYEILQGESVHLNGSGGTSYAWSPAGGLDNAGISDPIATPQKTTAYDLTITDSIGCTTSGIVLIVVEETAFIPEIFTPNDDGKNDELRVYGFDIAVTFTFSIYNREGNEVFTTSNGEELANTGWNGTSNGAKQSAGIYFWKITGKNDQGTDLLLNGKSTGSIVLMR